MTELVLSILQTPSITPYFFNEVIRRSILCMNKSIPIYLASMFRSLIGVQLFFNRMRISDMHMDHPTQA